MMALPEPPPSLLQDASLFLDFDGTLCEFVDPDRAPHFGSKERQTLRDLHRRLDGRVAVISGRSIESLSALIGLDRFDLAGSHGAERRSANGTATVSPAHPKVGDVRAEARALGQQLGVIVEEKPTGAALHYRSNPAQAGQVQSEARELARRYGFELRPGSMVAEVRARGADKGDAVRSFMAEKPFAEGTPLFIGDDLTDEDGFAASIALGGNAILVGKPRDTHAQFGLPDVAATLAWLSA